MKLINITMKNKFAKDFSIEDIEKGRDFIEWELNYYNAPNFIRRIVLSSFSNFEKGKFSYDGATFVKERSLFDKKTPIKLRGSLFESASLVHDEDNHKGLVGFWVDAKFLAIMIFLQYPKSQIIKRTFLMFVGTWLNVLRHKYLTKKYKSDLTIKNENKKWNT